MVDSEWVRLALVALTSSGVALIVVEIIRARTQRPQMDANTAKVLTDAATTLLKPLQERIDQLELSVTDYRKKLVDTEEESRERLAEAQEALDAARQQLADLRASLDEALQRLEDATVELEHLRQRVAEREDAMDVREQAAEGREVAAQEREVSAEEREARDVERRSGD